MNSFIETLNIWGQQALRFALPTSVAWWLRQSAPIAASQQKPHTTVVVTDPNTATPALTIPRTIPAPVRPAPSPVPISGAAWALAVWSLLTLALFFWLGVRWRQVA